MIEYKIYKNPNEEEYKEIIEAVKANDNYCPCIMSKTEDTKCMCKDFREMQNADFCHCGRFYKVPMLDTIALVGNVTEDAEYFEQWEQLLTKQNFIVIPVKWNGNNIFHHNEKYTDLCRAKIHKADAVFLLDDETDWILDMEVWSETIGKKVLHRSDLSK